MSLVQFAYQFSNTVLPTLDAIVAPARIQFDALYPYSTVTRIAVPIISSNGNNVHDYLLSIPVDARIVVQAAGDATRSVEFVSTAPCVDRVDVVDIPVAWVSNEAALNNNQSVALFVISTAAPPDTAHALVAFDVAKTHLRITDDDHDDEIRTKVNQASAVIADYLKDRFDETWDESTTPLHVQAATLKLLGSLYERRGDDSSTSDNHESAVWDEIARILARSRDPALA